MAAAKAEAQRLWPRGWPRHHMYCGNDGTALGDGDPAPCLAAEAPAEILPEFGQARKW